MYSRISRLFVILLVVLFLFAAVNLFTPFLGKARLGPMAGFSAPGGAGGIGPMSFAMMREAHAMADVESEFDYIVRNTTEKCTLLIAGLECGYLH